MKSARLLLSLLFALFAIGTSAQDATGQSQWKDSYNQSGSLDLSGDQLTGELFGNFTGTVSATSDGYLFIGYWIDIAGGAECGPNNAYVGPMKLLFNSAVTSFTGSFGYCRENTDHDDLTATGFYTGTLQSGSLDFSGISGGGTSEVPTDLPETAASLSWTSNGSAGFTWSTPVVLDDRVFLQDQDGGFDIFSTSNGEKLLYRDVANAFPTNSPIYANNFIYMIADGLRKIDPTDGSELGHFVNSSLSSQSPAVFDSLVIVGDSSTVYGIDVNSMAQVWAKDLGTSSSIDVAISEDILYVFANKLYALNPATGDEYWSVSAPEENGFNIGSVGGGYLSVFENDFSSTQLHTYLLNTVRTSSPSLAWSADMGAGAADRSPPAIDGDLVFANSRVGTLKAFQLSGDGTPLWEKTVRSNGSATALPLATNGAVIIQEEGSSNTFQLVGYNGYSGTEIFRTDISGMGVAWGQPTIKDGVVYSATDHSGALYAIAVSGLSGEWAMIKGNAQLTGSSEDSSESSTGKSTAVFSNKILSIPSATVLEQYYSLELNYIENSNPIQFGLLSATEITAQSSTSASFVDGALTIPVVNVDGAEFRVELTLVSESPILFTLTSAN